MLTLSKPQAHSYDNSSDEVIGYSVIAVVELVAGSAIIVNLTQSAYDYYSSHGTWTARSRTKEFMQDGKICTEFTTWDHCVSDFWATSCLVGDRDNEVTTISC